MTVADTGWIDFATTQKSSGCGYPAGNGGVIVQQTSKTTGVTLSKMTGQITMNGAALAAAAKVVFVVTNTLCAATDVPVAVVVSPAAKYRASISSVAAGSFGILVENITASSLSETPIIGFALIKGATS